MGCKHTDTAQHCRQTQAVREEKPVSTFYDFCIFSYSIRSFFDEKVVLWDRFVDRGVLV